MLDPAEFRDDPETSGALKVYLADLVERYYDRVRRYVAEDWSGEWQHAASLSDWRDLKLTPEQLAALNEELGEVIERYTESAHAGAGAGADDARAMPVIVQLQSFPRRPQ